MAEGTYEYECERAELLGISPPDRDQFEAAAQLKRQQDENNEALNVREIFLAYLISLNSCVFICTHRN